MNDPGSAFTLISSALAKELGVRVEGPKDKFKMIDGKICAFNGRLGELELQLHDSLSVLVRHIRVVPQS